jgi:hypothetical protein
MVFYANPVNSGTDALISLGDGQSICVRWFQAAPSNPANNIAYHIYYATVKTNVFSEGVKFVSIDDSLEVNITGLTPGQQYFFCVRPVEYDPTNFDLADLPIAYDNLRFYPSNLLRADITQTSLLIPLMDVSDFPPTGVVKIGIELIQYLAIDTVNNNLVLSSLSQRGYDNTDPRIHTIAGFDGYTTWDPSVMLWTIGEDRRWDRIYVSQARFEYPNHPFTLTDGYHQVTTDLLHTDHTEDDALNTDFPMYDFSGYHRTDPVLLLNGTCVGSYIGGEQGCIDGYGNFQILRGMSLQDQNSQRQEVLLSVDGRPATLIQKVHTGITCSCYLASSEYPDDRCPKCYGTKFVFGYQQYFNPRRSDGRILVRRGPTEENVKMYDAGYESEYPLDLWTLNSPTINARDIIVLYDVNGVNEEFRYEVGGVVRNETIQGMQGAQHLKVMRIRKTDPSYQIRIFRDSSQFPSKLNTSIGFVPGIPPHTHEIVISEKIVSVNQINQTTALSQGHNHPIVNGEVMEVLGHTHTIILP